MSSGPRIVSVEEVVARPCFAIGMKSTLAITGLVTIILMALALARPEINQFMGSGPSSDGLKVWQWFMIGIVGADALILAACKMRDLHVKARTTSVEEELRLQVTTLGQSVALQKTQIEYLSSGRDINGEPIEKQEALETEKEKLQEGIIRDKQKVIDTLEVGIIELQEQLATYAERMRNMESKANEIVQLSEESQTKTQEILELQRTIDKLEAMNVDLNEKNEEFIARHTQAQEEFGREADQEILDLTAQLHTLRKRVQVLEIEQIDDRIQIEALRQEQVADKMQISFLQHFNLDGSASI